MKLNNFPAGVIVGACVTFSICLSIFRWKADNDPRPTRAELVKAGLAEWVVVDAHGYVEFRMKERAK